MPVKPIQGDQLSLLDLPPVEEEVEQAIAPLTPPLEPGNGFKVGDRVQCPDGSGRVYHADGTYIWVEIDYTAKPYEPDQVSRYTPNPHLLDYHQRRGKAA